MVDPTTAKLEYCIGAIKATYGEIARMELLIRADKKLLEEIPDNGEKAKVTKEANDRIAKFENTIADATESIKNIEEQVVVYQEELRK